MPLGQAILFVKDLPRMLAFYRDVLGAVPTADASDGWLVLDTGGARLALHALPPHIAAQIEIGDPPARRGDTATKLVFEVADFDHVRANLLARGHAVDPVFHHAGRPRCDVLDPEGNVIQIVTV